MAFQAYTQFFPSHGYIYCPYKLIPTDNCQMTTIIINAGQRCKGNI
jgi:hypothetical protein